MVAEKRPFRFPATSIFQPIPMDLCHIFPYQYKTCNRRVPAIPRWSLWARKPPQPWYHYKNLKLSTSTLALPCSPVNERIWYVAPCKHRSVGQRREVRRFLRFHAHARASSSTGDDTRQRRRRRVRRKRRLTGRELRQRGRRWVLDLHCVFAQGREGTQDEIGGQERESERGVIENQHIPDRRCFDLQNFARTKLFYF